MATHKNASKAVTTPLIHIGYHKTGTTWLQDNLFANAEAGFVTPWSPRDVICELVVADPFDFDAEAASAYFGPGIASASHDGLVPVVTHERLSGSPYSGGFDSKTIGERLAAVFPRGRVLIMIREQKSMIVSVYKQYIRVGGPATIETFITLPFHQRYSVPAYDLRFHEYHRQIRHYQALFGRDRVLVLPFERLKRDSNAVVSEISTFALSRKLAAISPERRNVGMGGLSAALTRPLNLLFSRSSLNPGAPFYAQGFNHVVQQASIAMDEHLPASWNELYDKRLRRHVEEVAGPRFRESNRLTSELIGIDLKSLGYDC